jgi:starvation-inducible DNA-binding protein
MVVQTETRVIARLRQSQANAVISYLNAKRYHWFMYGPLYRDLHLFYDELASDAFAEIDPFAERIRMLGGDCLSTPRELESSATIHVAADKPTVRQMLDHTLRSETQIIEEMRSAAALADEEKDCGTNDLYAGFVQTHEKHAWFVREFLRREDGMVS